MEKDSKFSKIVKTEIGEGSRIFDQVNLYGCKIGKNCKIDAFVYIEEGVEIGDNSKIRAHTFIPTGVKIGKNVFVGPGVMFTNDRHPKAHGKWKLEGVIVQDDASIGAGAIILPGVTICKGSTVGAGAVVTKSVREGVTVIGNPAKEINILL